MKEDELPIGRAKDLTGQKFGRLTVLYRCVPPKQNSQRGAWWKCLCECGKITKIASSSLVRGDTKSCGCLKKENKFPPEACKKSWINRRKISPGDRFGKLTVQKELSERYQGHIVWQCQCDCGTTKNCTTSALRAGHYKSCGSQSCKYSYQNKNKLKIEAGDKFGFLTVIKKDGNTKSGHALYLCECDCGNTKKVTANHLNSGSTISCGCKHISIGEHKIKTILDGLKIKYETEKSIAESQRLDFYLSDYNIAIEFDGEGHYKEWSLGNTSLEYRQQLDQKKNQYCKDNGIALIRIPYWDRDKITKEYILERLNNPEKYDVNNLH